MLSVPELTYEKARDQVRCGDILLTSGNFMFSKLIKFATRSQWSHCAFIMKQGLSDGKYRLFVYESVENSGVRCIPLSSYVYDYQGSNKGYNGKLMILRHQDFMSSKLWLLSNKAVSMLGHPYDSIEIAKIAGRLLVRRFGIGSILQRKDNGVDICSEYVERCFYPMGIYFTRNDKSFITPNDIYKDRNVKSLFLIKPQTIKESPYK
jgi:hypothetical protein